MKNQHGIYSITNYIGKDHAANISNNIQPMLQAGPDPTIYGALGFATQAEARLMSSDRPVLAKRGDIITDTLSDQITKIGLDVKALLSAVYNKELYLIQLTYNQMRTGAFNNVHVDDATGMYNHLEYAALLYTNTQGKHYTGGEIYFPQQDLSFSPEAGTLIFFKGDEDKPHGVKPVLSGYRENIIMFFSSEKEESYE